MKVRFVLYVCAFFGLNPLSSFGVCFVQNKQQKTSSPSQEPKQKGSKKFGRDNGDPRNLTVRLLLS